MTGNLHVGLAAIGAAIGVGLIGMKASEAVGRNPGAATQILVQAHPQHRVRGRHRLLRDLPRPLILSGAGPPPRGPAPSLSGPFIL